MAKAQVLITNCGPNLILYYLKTSFSFMGLGGPRKHSSPCRIAPTCASSLILRGFLNLLFLFGDSENGPVMEKLECNCILLLPGKFTQQV